jgi:phosphate transport system substrate-binding protein
MMKNVVLKGFIISIVLLCLGPVSAESQSKQIVRISGAGLLADSIISIKDDYEKINPNCSFSVTGATAAIGFKKLLEGDAEMAMMTRKVNAEEAKIAEAKGINLASKFIGKVGLAIITNSKIPVNELTMDQLSKIFKGDVTNWSQVGGPNEPIKVTTRAVPETGAGVMFQDVVLKGAPYSKDAQIMSSYGTTIQVCGKSMAIGYIPTTTIHFDKLTEKGLKIIKIKKDTNAEPYQLASGVARETLYPISVDFLLYWNSKQENSCVRGFADFCEKQTQ